MTKSSSTSLQLSSRYCKTFKKILCTFSHTFSDIKKSILCDITSTTRQTLQEKRFSWWKFASWVGNFSSAEMEKWKQVEKSEKARKKQFWGFLQTNCYNFNLRLICGAGCGHNISNIKNFANFPVFPKFPTVFWKSWNFIENWLKIIEID